VNKPLENKSGAALGCGGQTSSVNWAEEYQLLCSCPGEERPFCCGLGTRNEPEPTPANWDGF